MEICPILSPAFLLSAFGLYGRLVSGTVHNINQHLTNVPLYSNLLGIETAVIAIAAIAVIAVTRTIINFIFFPPVSWWFPVY